MLEQTFYGGCGGTWRPFVLASGVKHRYCSHPLERVLVDFGSDHAFRQVHKKLQEHYGISVSDHLPRTITLKHAAKMASYQATVRGQQHAPSAQRCVISETDGSMVPLVAIDEQQRDRRKKKTLHYREARLTLAHAKGSATPIISGTFKETDKVGEHIADCVNRVGQDKQTQIHSVGDGAVWIADQVEKRFGSQATYLVDFYHVCEYLASAAGTCAINHPTAWMDEQKRLLKQSEANKVLNNLHPFIEPTSIADEQAPVRVCYRYLKNRRHQLDYKRAIENDLPIGSGEIESAHRYILQKRLKIQGAWWLEQSAEQMIALRTHRANDDWDQYWQKLAA